MTDTSGEMPGDEELAEMVHGNELNVPSDARTVGPWTHTDEGEEYRELTFLPLYQHPYGLGTAALMGRQARDGRVVYGIAVNVAAELSAGEADSLRAALVSLIENVNRNNAELP